jgi:hypothetical protein
MGRGGRRGGGKWMSKWNRRKQIKTDSKIKIRRNIYNLSDREIDSGTGRDNDMQRWQTDRQTDMQR